MDQVKVTGTVTKVSINFSTAPSAKKPEIRLFVLVASKMASSPNIFKITDSRQLEVDAKNIEREPGVQTFSSIKLPIKEGAYPGIRFSPGAGNPFATERNQYCTYFYGIPYQNQPMEFTRCRTNGIEMSFEVRPETG